LFLGEDDDIPTGGKKKLVHFENAAAKPDKKKKTKVYFGVKN